MENPPVAIHVANLKKHYRLGVIGADTLQEALQSWWAKIRGKEDPNTKIGATAVKKDHWALDGVSLTIRQGERVGIIGRNGAGKSTLLKILSQITAPTEGEIDIYGRLTSMLEIGTGFHSEMTGRENTYMNGAILGMSKQEIDAQMDSIIRFADIGEYIDTPIKRYSSGMLVKLAFSVAVHLKSDIVIMDEVLAVGDMAFQQKCLDKMREISEQQNRTVLYVSHAMATIRRLCNRCIVLGDGKVLYDGDVEKAIAIYMENGMDKDGVDIDLTGKSNTIRTWPSAFRHLTLKGAHPPKYESSDSLHMTLTLDLAAPTRQLCAAIRLQTPDGITIGSAFSNPMDFETPGIHKIALRMPLNTLIDGTFYVTLGILQTNASEHFRLLEISPRACQFDVCGNDKWNATKYGYVTFQNLTATREN